MTDPTLFALPPTLALPSKPAPPSPPTPHTGQPIPQWLLQRLQRAGHIDAATGATRRTRSMYCPHCRHGVMRGLTSPPTQWPADVDPTPLAPAGETTALLLGYRTFELRWIGDHYELERRDLYRIRNLPIATLKRTDVLVEHHCRTQATWPTQDTVLADSLGLARAPHHYLDGEYPY